MLTIQECQKIKSALIIYLKFIKMDLMHLKSVNLNIKKGEIFRDAWTKWSGKNNIN
jgi:hypothetical protein